MTQPRTPGVSANPYFLYGWHTYQWALWAPTADWSAEVFTDVSVAYGGWDPLTNLTTLLVDVEVNIPGLVSVVWGTRSEAYTGETGPVPMQAGVPQTIQVFGLEPNTTYYVNAKWSGALTFPSGQTVSVSTQSGELSSTAPSSTPVSVFGPGTVTNTPYTNTNTGSNGQTFHATVDGCSLNAIKYYRDPTDTVTTSIDIGVARMSDHTILYQTSVTGVASGWNQFGVPSIPLTSGTTYMIIVYWPVVGAIHPTDAGRWLGTIGGAIVLEGMFFDPSSALIIPTQSGGDQWIGLDFVIGVPS